MLVVLPQQGLSALAMRNLPAMHAGPMTIYNYGDGRDGLEALLVEDEFRAGPDVVINDL